ncbi:MAG: hypothetical protein DRJ38_01565 [Thermoprotei archaeon]|nr:MAG: hypothetical protein DRJ38_01565 [Thermoprotei archaeon]
MRLDVVATVLIFVIALSSMLFLYTNSRFVVLRYSVEAWKCAEIQADKFKLGRKLDDIGLIEIRTFSWNLMINTWNIGEEKLTYGCAYTYRLLSNGTLVYVKTCPYKRCKH